MPIPTGSMFSASFWYARWSLFLLLMTHEMGFCSRAQEASEAVPKNADSADLVIVVGAGGEATYESLFSQWASCLLYTSPSPRDRTRSRMPSSA